MRINFYAVPNTSEYFLLGTACAEVLSTANYAVTTGFGRGMVANNVLLSVEDANVRFKLNGSAPATACGHVLEDGNYLTMDDVAQMEKFQVFNEGATATAYVHITYFMG